MIDCKKLGIIGALDEEVQTVINSCNIKCTENALGTCFYEGSLGDANVVVVRCGVGKVNSAIAAQRLIDVCGCDAIINIGVAGSINNTVRKNHVVLSTELLEHDMDALEGAGVIPRMDSSVFVSDDCLLEEARAACEKVVAPGCFHLGKIVSGDQFINSSEKKKWLESTFGALCAEMEGAAIAHTCTLNNVPFLIMRSISDLADEDAQDSFEEMKEEAIDYTSSVLLEMIK